MTKKMPPLKISTVKGRPMLHWVGKKPLDRARHFPAQLCETVGVENPPDEPSYRRFVKANYNLLFHGDNKEILSSLLISGFRGKIDLIYIDPPFNSAADYVRKVKLRGQDEKLSGKGHDFLEEVQYTDIWANDNYLQFMYERLILLRELLSDKGSIYLHCDWRKSHHLRFLLDEVFGENNFVNEIVWCYTGPTNQKKNWPRKHDTIFLFAKTNHRIFNSDAVRVPFVKSTHSSGKTALTGKKEKNVLDNLDEKGKIPEDWWADIADMGKIHVTENLDYPTQKPEALLERIIKASSNEDSIVLDCFCGSGTTAAIAEKLGRRWIMADINKGAIQTTVARLQSIIKTKDSDCRKNGHGLIHYRVNNYDFLNQNTLKKIIVSKYGIKIDRKDLFFDGTISGQLAIIVDLNKPLTRLDIQIIKDEIVNNRPEEERNITVFCNGSELGIISEINAEKKPINKITVCDIQQDGMLTNQPAETEVTITKKGKQAQIKINDYISPTILARMEIERTVFNEQIDDFRAQINYVLIDTDYDGKNFNIMKIDLPKKKKDLVVGEYKLSLPRPGVKVAVKIVDMLGEETLVVK